MTKELRDGDDVPARGGSVLPLHVEPSILIRVSAAGGEMTTRVMPEARAKLAGEVVRFSQI